MSGSVGRTVKRLLASRWLVLGLLVAVVWVGFGPWIAAQARAVAVLASLLEVPVLTWIVDGVTREPRVEESIVAGMATTVARPGGEGPWPAVVFVNGATKRGRHHPHVQRLARGLARAGHLVLVPELPGLRIGEITAATRTAATAVARAASERRDARDGRVGLVGVSVGTSLALLAAEDARLAGRVTAVAGFAPYTSLEQVIRLATTGFYRHDHGLVRYEPSSFVALSVARSLAAGLPPGPDRNALVDELRAVDDSVPDPLAELRTRPIARLGAEARALVRLLLNRDGRRFDDLYAMLPRSMRARVVELSPLAGADRLRAPVELASAPRDKYFPVAESYALARAAPRVRVTVTSTLAHAIPEPSLADVADLLRFNAFVVRSLRALRGDPRSA